MRLDPGMLGEMEKIVTDAETAKSIAGGNLQPVLSTPHLISWMETTAMDAVEMHLDAGQTTVGTFVNIKHMAATPVGMKVRIRMELVSVDGRKLTFKAEAWDELEKVAEGEHGRFVIDIDRFRENYEAKLLKWDGR